MKQILIPAGRRTRIIHRSYSSLVTPYRFEIAPAVQNGYISGTVKICGSNWIPLKPTQVISLQTSHIFTAGVWDAFFSVVYNSAIKAVVISTKDYRKMKRPASKLSSVLLEPLLKDSGDLFSRSQDTSREIKL